MIQNFKFEHDANQKISALEFPADDLHVHFRDDERLASVAGYTARQFNRALVMPNLVPPVRTVAEAVAYRKRILNVTGDQFEPLMTLYLTEKTSHDDLMAIVENPGVVHAIKYYPAGATTNSDDGVSSIRKMDTLLHQMQLDGVVLSLHGEVADGSVDVFDREKRFLEDFQYLRFRYPKLRMVLEHITTAEAVRAVQAMHTAVLAGWSPYTAATITPQHLLATRNDMLGSGIRPHYYCKPILKREEDRQALLEAATSGETCFFLGTDSAPHGKHDKENACGCAGCFTGLHALELYAEAFDSIGKLEMLPDFAGTFGAQFYGLGSVPDDRRHIARLERQEWQVPQELPFVKSNPLIPFYAGETLHWKIVR